MARTFDEIDAPLTAWIGRQPMFFVATAPRADTGHVNVSPKGPISTFEILGPRAVAYLDVTGSGAETIAHLRENGRIVVMLCAFDGPPQVVRLHGRGEAILPSDERFEELRARFTTELPEAAVRAIVRVDVQRIARSCGYTVPLMRHEGERDHMAAWTDKKLRSGGSGALDAYRADKNETSIDGLPALA
ncbi:pyridoxamine 5'-phosphate oxidase family protein [Capillimicrobium parvum]|uniref:Pyridoxamine 5'-phosphate oxidase N-terminal domain-containing protein n=1 Tax=Capillimicrobium parvum TaxID=2884022 RepID=A0A9E6XZH1_9ACTN|nr:pyridoxamine 5'-phosphate oxidase family protein [Capillimicrobium parvum]UGS36621.1 hypothetical protein DSM104329_03029 [Capillimicrobium parvum]